MKPVGEAGGPWWGMGSTVPFFVLQCCTRAFIHYTNPTPSPNVAGFTTGQTQATRLGPGGAAHEGSPRELQAQGKGKSSLLWPLISYHGLGALAGCACWLGCIYIQGGVRSLGWTLLRPLVTPLGQALLHNCYPRQVGQSSRPVYLPGSVMTTTPSHQHKAESSEG